MALLIGGVMTRLVPSDRPAASPALVLQSPTPSSSLDGRGIHVVGGTLRDAAGQVLQLHGVNRSSWEFTCYDGSGNTHDGPADQSEVDAMKSWNINAVRVVLNEDCWLGINGVTVGGAAYQTAIEDYVNLLTNNNIVAIINLHFSAPGTILAGTYRRNGELEDQFPMPDRDHSPAFWSSVASTFKGNGLVLFEPYNEPFPDDDRGGDTEAAWTCWRDGGACPPVTGFPDYANAGMQELVSAIRGSGATNPIILTGTHWGTELHRWLEYEPQDTLNPPQLTAGWHSYQNGLSCETSTCWNTTFVPIIEQAPLVATEIGEFDCKHTYIDQVMGFFDSEQQSYIAWMWSVANCAQAPALLQDWSGTPTQTFGQGYRDHLLSLGQAGKPPTSPTPTPAATPSASARGPG